MAACIAEELTDSSTCEGSIILECGRISSSSGYNYCIIHCSLLPEGIDNGCNRTSLLPNCHIDTINRLALKELRPLIDYGIYCNCRFPCLTVTDYKLPLAAPYRNHGVNRLKTCLERLADRLTEDNAGSLPFKRHISFRSSDGSQSVEGMT